jgi:glucose-6-phosphate dehydrogenase assembly protein OpcA
VVSISAGGDEVRKLPSAARSLVVGSLPTSFWWARHDPPVLAGEMFHELRPMADQVIYSSLNWDDPVRSTLATADWVEQSGPDDPVAIDLAWRALRPWRQLISQSFDPSALPGAVDRLDRVEIDHGPGGLAQAWLLAGWLASALGWTETERTLVKGHEVSWRFRKAGGELVLSARRHGEGAPQVRNVRMSWQDGGRAAALTFAPTVPGYFAATAEGFDAETRVLAARDRSRAALVAAELAELEPDPVFRDALRVSRRLAEDLVL